MRLPLRSKNLLLSAGIAIGWAVLPTPAVASHRPEPFDARATIVRCGGDGLTLAAELAPAAGEAGARARRAVRRATLRLRFEAAPLYGRTRARRKVDLGRTAKARRVERFQGLRAQAYMGLVHYRWVRGGRTVMSGTIRSRTVRAAGRRGRAVCSLRVGRPPQDTRPPFIVPIPSDDGWKRGPLDVHLYAVDDLSGVALVGWRVDDGPVGFGRNLRIGTEGVHRLDYAARDAAGNQTPLLSVTLRVDMNPPTAPTVTSPSGTITSSRPEIRWEAATDTGAGVLGYFALVRDADGTIVWSQVAPAETTAATVGHDLAPGQYTAEVIAVDGAAPEPFTSTARQSFAVVAATAADTDGDGVADASDNCPFTANADQANSGGGGAGDACEDRDGDGVLDAADNCRDVSNAAQTNTGGAAAGDACEDRDGDGDVDAADNCVATPNGSQRDSDGDGVGNQCDSDADGDGTANTSDPDDDADAIVDETDQCPVDPGPVSTNGCPTDGLGMP